MRLFFVTFATVALTSVSAYAAGSASQLTTDLATLKSKVAILKSDLAAGNTPNIAQDKQAVRAAREAVKADLSAAQTLLAPARAQVTAARQATEQAERKLRQDKASGNNALVAADINALITAFQGQTDAQNAYIQAAASNGLPVPSAEQLAVNQAAASYRVIALQLKADTLAQNTAAIATDQTNLANAAVTLSNAQAALINAQATSTPDPVMAEAEKLLGTNVAHNDRLASVAPAAGSSSSAFGGFGGLFGRR